MKIYEAFKPVQAKDDATGLEEASNSAGLFTGDVGCIREWVAITGAAQYRAPNIRLQGHEVKLIDAKVLADWKAAKKKVDQAARALSEVVSRAAQST